MDSLIALAKSAWKRSVKLHHEANGGDPVAWRSANEIYSAAIKKITQSMRLGKRRFVAYECKYCGKRVRKMVVSHVQWGSFLCGDIECLRAHRRVKKRRWTLKNRVTYDRVCKNPECGRRFFTVFPQKHCCSQRCGQKVYYRGYRARKKQMNQITQKA